MTVETAVHATARGSRWSIRFEVPSIGTLWRSNGSGTQLRPVAPPDVVQVPLWLAVRYWKPTGKGVSDVRWRPPSACTLVTQGNHGLATAEAVYRVSSPYDHALDPRWYCNPTELTREGLLVDVRMEENAGCKHRAVGGDDVPRVGVVIPALIGVPNGNDEVTYRR